MANAVTLARGLGAFSVGLGLAQVSAPERVAEIAGIEPDPTRLTIMRAIGVRELATAPGLLATRRPAAWTWMRVAGDAMDLALLGTALASRGVRRDRATAALVAVAGVTALDLLGGLRLSRVGAGKGSLADHGAVRPIRRAVTIDRAPEEVYAFWRDLENLPSFMRHLEDVTVLSPTSSRWQAKGPAGSSVSWDAEIVADEPGRLIAWRSVEGSSVRNAGTVRFERAPGDRGTEVLVDLAYEPPAGGLGAAVARLFGEEPAQQTSEDLRRLKQVLETGEVVESEATVGGRRRRQRPAKPLETVPALA